MLTPDFPLPDEFVPLTDPRHIAATLSNAHFEIVAAENLSATRQTDVIPYTPDTPNDMQYEEASDICEVFFHWYVAHPVDGLVGQAHTRQLRDAVGHLGEIVLHMPGKSKADVESMRTELRHLHAHSREEYLLLGQDQDLQDAVTAMHAGAICSDLVNDQPQVVGNLIRSNPRQAVVLTLGGILDRYRS